MLAAAFVILAAFAAAARAAESDWITVSTLAGTAGSANGTGSAARFDSPFGIAYDPADGCLYVADTSNDTIRKVTSAGVVSTLAGTAGSRGSTDGTGGAARFNGRAASSMTPPTAACTSPTLPTTRSVR